MFDSLVDQGWNVDENLAANIWFPAKQNVPAEGTSYVDSVPAVIKYSRIATANLVSHFVFRTHISSIKGPSAFVIFREVFGARGSC